MFDELSLPKSESVSPEISQSLMSAQSPDHSSVEHSESPEEDEEADIIDLEKLSDVERSGLTVSSIHTIEEENSEEEEDGDESDSEMALCDYIEDVGRRKKEFEKEAR